MVSVSLKDLVSVPGTRLLWPSEFEVQVSACEANPEDRTPFGVLADWCDEHGEPSLAEAFRWLHKRPAVEVIHKNQHISLDRHWAINGLPATIAGQSVPNCDVKTLAGRVAQLSDQIAKARADLA